VIRTRVGYSGGKKKNPTYHSLGDHTETIQIDFDPERVTYRELLDVFWSSHNPCSLPWTRQYMSAVFYHGEDQKRLAEKSRDASEKKLEGKIHPRILPASDFYLAEDYHQKYQLRRYSDFVREMTAYYPSPRDFVASTAVARINGYLAGYGGSERLRKELPQLGLSPEGGRRLLEIVSAMDR